MPLTDWEDVIERAYYYDTVVVNSKLITNKNTELIELKSLVSQLLFVINEEDDGTFFLCKEAQPIIDRLKELT